MREAFFLAQRVCARGSSHRQPLGRGVLSVAAMGDQSDVARMSENIAYVRTHARPRFPRTRQLCHVCPLACCNRCDTYHRSCHLYVRTYPLRAAQGVPSSATCAMCATGVLPQVPPRAAPVCAMCVPPAWHTHSPFCDTCVLPQCPPCVCHLRGTHTGHFRHPRAAPVCATCVPLACCPSLRHVCATCVAHTCATCTTCALHQFAPCVCHLRGTHMGVTYIRTYGKFVALACCPRVRHVRATCAPP